jgi:hypothetical protein
VEDLAVVDLRPRSRIVLWAVFVPIALAALAVITYVITNLGDVDCGGG